MKSTTNAKSTKPFVDAATTFLVKREYQILETSWTCETGEIDIIAKDDNTIVFVEVQGRFKAEDFPKEAIMKSKREKFEMVALSYLSNCDYVDMSVRFDIISIVALDMHRALIRHHINAFSTD